MGFAGSEVDGHDLDTRSRPGGDEPGHAVANESHIALGRERAKPDFVADQGLRDDGWDERPRALAWPERVERPDRDDRRIERSIIALRKLVGPDLGGRVR